MKVIGAVRRASHFEEAKINCANANGDLTTAGRNVQTSNAVL